MRDSGRETAAVLANCEIETRGGKQHRDQRYELHGKTSHVRDVYRSHSIFTMRATVMSAAPMAALYSRCFQ